MPTVSRWTNLDPSLLIYLHILPSVHIRKDKIAHGLQLTNYSESQIWYWSTLWISLSSSTYFYFDLGILPAQATFPQFSNSCPTDYVDVLSLAHPSGWMTLLSSSLQCLILMMSFIHFILLTELAHHGGENERESDTSDSQNTTNYESQPGTHTCWAASARALESDLVCKRHFQKDTLSLKHQICHVKKGR